MTISANEIKKHGVTIFDDMLKKFDELIINVRGKIIMQYRVLIDFIIKNNEIIPIDIGTHDEVY
ncbi:hypothetical protein [Sulfurimonas sp.]|jgi:hypothetical protein|uniref:hypothetical protein n=1 Tax=Sulfurimonas sp. TaxID=2022749 RepID=UPI0025E321B3|nr:hypothetical protein [Sulfurimonas sp.]